MFGFRKPSRPATPQPATPGQAASLQSAHGPTMGTEWAAHFVTRDDVKTKVVALIQQAVDLVDGQMSTWKPASDLSRVNAAPVGDWVPVPAELAFVVRQAIALGRATSGAFDITVGSQVDAWGFGPPGMTDPPLSSLPSAGSGALELSPDGTALRKTAPLSLDLSGIAKGYGVELMAKVLEKAGIVDYLVILDGELRLKGRKPGAEGRWSIALDAPIRGAREAWDALEPQDGALATSGDYRHFRLMDGKALAHTIDPATGRPLDNGIASVTVFDPQCWRADALATALMVLGPQKGIALAQARNIPALFLLRDDDGISERVTGPFDELCRGG